MSPLGSFSPAAWQSEAWIINPYQGSHEEKSGGTGGCGIKSRKLSIFRIEEIASKVTYFGNTSWCKVID